MHLSLFQYSFSGALCCRWILRCSSVLHFLLKTSCSYEVIIVGPLISFLVQVSCWYLVSSQGYRLFWAQREQFLDCYPVPWALVPSHPWLGDNKVPLSSQEAVLFLSGPGTFLSHNHVQVLTVAFCCLLQGVSIHSMGGYCGVLSSRTSLSY